MIYGVALAVRRCVPHAPVDTFSAGRTTMPITDEYTLLNLCTTLGAPARWNNPMNAVGFASGLVRVGGITPAVEEWQKTGDADLEHWLRLLNDAVVAAELLVLKLPPLDRSSPSWARQGQQLLGLLVTAHRKIIEHDKDRSEALLLGAMNIAKNWITDAAPAGSQMAEWSFHLIKHAVEHMHTPFGDLRRALLPWKERDVHPTGDKARAFEACLLGKLYKPAYDLLDHAWDG